MADRDNDNNREHDADELRDIRVRRDSPAPGTRDVFLDLRNSLVAYFLEHPNPEVDMSQRRQVRALVQGSLNDLLEERGVVLNRSERRQLLEAIVTDLLQSHSQSQS